MRFATLDIETSNLNADFGFIICVVVKEYGSDNKPKIFRIDQYPGWEKNVFDDKKLVKDVRNYLENFDGIITYNGRNFDLPFLTSQVVAYGYQPIKALFHVDVFYTTRYRLRLHNSKLNTLITFLNTYRGGKKKVEEKTAINTIYYKKAITGRKDGIDYIVKHCVKDVVALEQCYDLLKDQVFSLRKGY
jgi:uncharacterized protein YprB with RNaseH-like and TPR domain